MTYEAVQRRSGWAVICRDDGRAHRAFYRDHTKAQAAADRMNKGLARFETLE